MGGNTGKGHRNGPVKNRKQVYNSKTKQYIKINTKTGKIMASKKTSFKGVRSHKKRLI